MTGRKASAELLWFDIECLLHMYRIGRSQLRSGTPVSMEALLGYYPVGRLTNPVGSSSTRQKLTGNDWGVALKGKLVSKGLSEWLEIIRRV